MIDQFQIITPFGLGIALFSVDQKVIPYEMNFRSFLLTTAVMFALVQIVVRICAAILEPPALPGDKLRPPAEADPDNPRPVNILGRWFQNIRLRRERLGRDDEPIELRQL
jgi:hypothetical protein